MADTPRDPRLVLVSAELMDSSFARRADEAIIFPSRAALTEAVAEALLGFDVIDYRTDLDGDYMLPRDAAPVLVARMLDAKP